MFAAFLGGVKPFQWGNRFEKSSLRGATIGAPMHEKIIKIRENGCKGCAHNFSHLEAR